LLNLRRRSIRHIDYANDDDPHFFTKELEETIDVVMENSMDWEQKMKETFGL